LARQRTDFCRILLAEDRVQPLAAAIARSARRRSAAASGSSRSSAVRRSAAGWPSPGHRPRSGRGRGGRRPPRRAAATVPTSASGADASRLGNTPLTAESFPATGARRPSAELASRVFEELMGRGVGPREVVRGAFEHPRGDLLAADLEEKLPRAGIAPLRFLSPPYIQGGSRSWSAGDPQRVPRPGDPQRVPRPGKVAGIFPRSC
jgi:hypothetical protein